jgi:hypothetical protein
MRRELAKTLYVGYILATAASLIALPQWFHYRNPPYHHFGGFDIAHWLTGLIVYALELGIAAIYLKARCGRRIVLITSITLCSAAITYMLASFLTVIRQMPTL